MGSSFQGPCGFRRHELAAAGHRALLERWVENVVLRRYFDLVGQVAERRGLTRVLEIVDRTKAAA